MGADLYKRLGLPDNEKVLEKQRLKYGRNSLTEVDQNPWYCILIRQYTNLFSILLEVGCILCFIA